MARMLFLRDIDVDVQLRCRACGHGGILPRSILERRFGPNYPVLSIAPHYRCSRCEARDTESRPAVPDRFAGDAAPPPDDLSFDAPLAALQGLLASVRGPERPAGKAKAPAPPPPPWSGLDDPDDSLPAFKPFAVPKPAMAAGPALIEPALIEPAIVDLAETDWDEPSPAWTPAASGKVTRDLEELAADGPADADARPLWEPVSLADMASRLEGRQDEAADTTAFDLADRDAAPAGRDEGPLDETLAAMRRFFADADLADADQEEDAERPAAPKPAPVDAAVDEAEDRDDEDDDSDLPSVFSHKVFARTDFDDSDEEWDEVDVSGDAAGWAGDEADEEAGEEEPTDEDILAFAIRDPERPAPSPKAERAARPVPANDGDGFDRTLAALRSMIEDAATEPKPVPIRRKTRPSAEPPAPPDDPPDAESVIPDTAVPDEPPAVKVPAKAGRAAKTAAGPKRSAQEREIEEAMKALRDLVEDDDLSPVKPGAGSRPSFDAVDSFQELPPEKPAPPAAKKRVEADGDASPLSKTIAALRGMLELDGRRKR